MTHPCTLLPRLSAVALLSVVPGCFPLHSSGGGGGESGDKGPPDAKLGAHVAALRADEQTDRRIGVLPRDLSVPKAETEYAQYRSHALAAGVHMGIQRTSLSYLGIQDGQICFEATDFRPADDVSSKAFLLKQYQEEVTWVQLVAALDDLEDRAAWPAAAPASTLDSIEIIEEREKTFDKRKDLGGGEYVNVKEDQRVIDYKLCGRAPKRSDDARFLIAVTHTTSLPSHLESYIPARASHDQEYKDQYARRHDVLIVWALTDGDKVDLAK